MANLLTSTAAPLAATPLTAGTARAQALGLPATLFGFTPDQEAYWREPGLPWLTAQMLNHHECMPLDYRGHQALLCIGHMGSEKMAPRFPKDCSVQSAPVYEKQNLVVGRVYLYRYHDQATGAEEWEVGRLVKIGGNYLEAKADNYPTPSRWLLREEPGQEVWDVREVTHYVKYPLDSEAAAGADSTGQFLPWLLTAPLQLTVPQPEAASALAV